MARSALRLCGLLGLVLVAGCYEQDGCPPATPPGQGPDAAVAPPAADPPLPEPPGIVVRAKFYRAKGPCIQMDKARAMAALDAFEVVEVVSGALPAKWIEVQFHTGGGPSYPRDLTVGKIYTLRLTPSERTKRQLRENEKEGHSFLHIDGSELAEQKAR